MKKISLLLSIFFFYYYSPAQIVDALPCPAIILTGPADNKIKDGTEAVISVKPFDKVFGNNLLYIWTVSKGVINKGQGMSEIYVDTKGLKGQTITATVEVAGLKPGCASKKSITIDVDEPVLLNEQFNSVSANWTELKSDSLELQFKDGRYFMQNNGIRRFTIMVSIDTGYNFSISLSVAYISGNIKSGYGFVFGKRSSPKEYFGFEINAAGNYSVFKMSGGQMRQLVKWTPAAAIKKGTNAQNILMLKKEAKQWKFFVNNKLVKAIPAGKISGDETGLCISTKLNIAYDNFVIKQRK
jgi:hypothetical protein